MFDEDVDSFNGWLMDGAMKAISSLSDDDIDRVLALLDTAPVADDILYDKFGDALDIWPQEDEDE